MKTSLGLPFAVFAGFLILRLTSIIRWSYWWVTAPIWVPVSLIVVSFYIFIFFYYGKES